MQNDAPYQPVPAHMHPDLIITMRFFAYETLCCSFLSDDSDSVRFSCQHCTDLRQHNARDARVAKQELVLRFRQVHMTSNSFDIINADNAQRETSYH